MRPSSSVGMLRIACGLSGYVQPLKAVEQVCEQCLAGLGGAPASLVMVFFSGHHLDAARAIAYALRRRLDPKVILGVSADAVIGGDQELEQSPGISVFAASLPGVDLHVFRSEMLMNFVTAGDRTGLAAAAGFNPALRATFFFADPFSVPVNTLIPALSAVRPSPVSADGAPGTRAGGRQRRAPIIGGLASAGRQAGKNTLFLDDQVLHEGGIGVSLSGRVEVDTIVSQGCRPVGQPMIVTAGKGQLISGLAGRPALQVISDLVEQLNEEEKQLMQGGGLFVGRAISEYKDRFGRNDFLIRPIISVDRNSESIAVGDLLRVGQTVQLHLRDAQTAHEDLGMLLDLQRLHEPAVGAILMTCTGRGKRLFQVANHDAAAVAHAFDHARPGEEEAKGGTPLAAVRPPLPVAGFFAAGEIGPIGDTVFVHGHTACATFFRGLPPNQADV